MPKDFRTNVEFSNNVTVTGNINAAKYQSSAPASPLIGQIWVDSSTDIATFDGTVQTGNRNKIINGTFEIWQRGTSFSAVGYTADRWNIQTASGQTVSCTQQSFTPGNPITGYEPTYFLRTTWSGTPSGTFWLNQKIEDVRTFAGKAVTLSFWAKAGSNTSAFTPVIEQNFGTGGSSVVTTNGTAISLTTSWQRFTQIFNIPSISGKTIGTNSFLDIRPFNGSTSVAGNAIDIWGIQLEAGSSTTPLEIRPIGQELSLCQRYYYRTVMSNGNTTSFGNGHVQSSTNVRIMIATPVSLRTAGTATLPSVTTSTIGNFTVAGGGSSGTNQPCTGATIVCSTLSSGQVIDFSVATTVGTGPAVLYNGTSGSFIGIDAEI